MSVIQNLDSSLRTKFKSYLDEHGSLDNEEDCKRALAKIFQKNIQTIKSKVRQLRDLNNSKRELIQENLQVDLKHIDIFYDFIGEICLQVEEADLENPVLAGFA